LGTWHRLASLSDVRDGEGFPAELGELSIALYRVNGQIHAVDDVCTHEFAVLSQGFLEGGTIECPLHAAQFDVVTGKCLAGPAMSDLRTYQVRVEGDDIYVLSPDP
jgi:3-phenylpropionate/trans-cinnamate dioxygenase ferredoxin component